LIKFRTIANNGYYPDLIKCLWAKCFNVTITIILLFHMEGSAQILQTDSLQRINAADHIDRLKSGRLIVILPDYAEKISYLRQWSEDSRLSKGKNKRIKRSLSQTIAERDSFKSRFIHSMRSSYQFSSWGYIWKSEFQQVDQRGHISIYLEDDSEVNVHLELNTYFLQRGQTENGADAVIIYSASLEPLEKPFPYFMRINSASGLIESLFNPSSFSWKDFESMVAEWDQRLVRFWEKKEKALN